MRSISARGMAVCSYLTTLARLLELADYGLPHAVGRHPRSGPALQPLHVRPRVLDGAACGRAGRQQPNGSHCRNPDPISDSARWNADCAMVYP
jgi:hypothetical protein